MFLEGTNHERLSIGVKSNPIAWLAMQVGDGSVTQLAHSGAVFGEFVIQVDGQALPARHGQTVAAVMIAAGRQIFRWTASGAPRGVFCGMGVCFDCIVTIDGMPDQRACVTPALPGMRVDTCRKEASSSVSAT